MTRVIVGLTLEGQARAFLVHEASLPRVPEVFGVDPTFIEPVPEACEGRVDLLALFIAQCRETHFGKRGAA